jgi:hypothetical protein
MTKTLSACSSSLLSCGRSRQSENFTMTKSVMDAGGGVSSSSESFQSRVGLWSADPGWRAVERRTSLCTRDFLSPDTASVSPLSPIQNLTIKDSGQDAVLRWEAISGAGSYSVYRDLGLNFVPGPGNLIGTTSNTTFTDTAVLSGPALQQYYIVIVNNP